MTLSELVKNAHIAYKGNVDYPAVGDDEYSVYVAIANRKQREWATDPYVDWASLYSDAPRGTVSGSSRIYRLADEIIRTAEFVYLDKDGIQHTIEVIKPREAQRASHLSAFMTGRTIRFTHDIPGHLAGAKLIVPAYFIPETLARPTDEVAVDDPNWLVYSLAAELARNDYSKDDQFANLQGMANDLYDKMRQANDELGYLQDARVPYGNDIMGV